IVTAHQQMPFHRIQHWTGLYFERKSLKDLGLRIQLGHWRANDRTCPLPTPAPGDDFVLSTTTVSIGSDWTTAAA
ncbi:hypothetical protein B0H10DRAFT_2338079, partial [Mycena sp. CBHHK59/15]